MSAALLEARGVSKEFPNGTRALRDVSLTVDDGTIHGLVGANGAGKSTLFTIIAGAIPPTAGSLRWRGEEVSWTAPGDSRAAGVATIHQHIPLVPTLTVLENVYLGELSGLYRRAPLMERYEQLCERLGYRADPGRIVEELPLGERQMVAVAQALATGASLVCMDEPTASMAQAEVEVLFDAVRRLRSDGMSFVFCSHFLDQVLELTDTVTVLRDGEVVATEDTAGLDEDALVDAMVGRTLHQMEDERATPLAPDAPVLVNARDLRSPGRLDGIDLTVRSGEIVGVAGILGSGRSELLEALFGADSRCSGEVTVRGEVVPHDVRARMAAGFAFVPENRVRQGLVPSWEIWRNVSLPDLATLSRRGVLPDHAAEIDRASAAITELGIRTPSADTPVTSLSGGNAQKVVFAKWLFGGSCVYLLDEPTVGVDVGAKADILRLVRDFAAQGNGVVIVSSGLEELLAVAHRILVMRAGRVVAERATTDTDEPELLALASGLTTVTGASRP
ncbi:monosaccharide ABC transporter ATP-binding protein (CUT2 family) [Haloactinopolyspora alba]|uniref:Monosaccharide ABC transporter ATP-binding protein (CUT2 family) n=1 Tax=Haloactinopolyspora alba TaxID=648780 RepID=A0A2P8EFI1_9ACTN|nr:sugar ABC transporter ATP-binding protein [Haloactinopolyspora alba]PSL08226.1 monosaccharide ABC transporter ATP-binding protein (CUT2 family) [Haloactinopolyspora alba]